MAIIDRFLERGRDFLGSRFPILCGAMTWISDPGLLSSVCNAGGFGLLGGGNAAPDIFQVDRVLVFIAGGIATGRMMAHLLTMGAAGIQMGTRFAAATL
jgi:NAD(P)H-dependent flavin oxidoreductase YrpB (nitropropane dioxygenase family)